MSAGMIAAQLELGSRSCTLFSHHQAVSAALARRLDL
jgi:hypothetical protein